MVTIKSIDVLSAGKMLGALYAILGVLIGAMFTLLALVGAAVGGGQGGPAAQGGAVALIFGAGAVIIVPLVYGVMGFIGGIITAALYNLIAMLVGGS